MNFNKYFLLIALGIVSFNFNCYSSDIEEDKKEVTGSLNEGKTAYDKFKSYKNDFRSKNFDNREKLLKEMETEFLPTINQVDDKSLYSSVNYWIKQQRRFLNSRSLVQAALSAGSSNAIK